jgi:hypothetical protein
MNYDLNFHELCEMNYYLKEKLLLINKRHKEQLCIGTRSNEENALKSIQHFTNWIEQNSSSNITISISNGQ